MMSGAKAPDFDAHGLLRATHSHNPIKYFGTFQCHPMWNYAAFSLTISYTVNHLFDFIHKPIFRHLIGILLYQLSLPIVQNDLICIMRMSDHYFSF